MSRSGRDRVVVRRDVRRGEPTVLHAWVADATGLAADAVDDVVAKGAVWVVRRRGRGAGKTLREHDPAAAVRPGDRVEVYRDPAVLAATAPDPEPIADRAAYSAWFKPAGLMSQGTKFGDHASLLRRIDRMRGARSWLVHRLDREAVGVVLVAHDASTAGTLSRAFAAGDVAKDYRVVVVGDLSAVLGERGVIDAPLDGKPSRTEFRVRARDSERDRTWLDVRIPTGRRHQIRRHLDGAGFPVLGDPRYGRGNKNRGGLRLAALAVTLQCPMHDTSVRFEIPPGRVPWLDATP